MTSSEKMDMLLDLDRKNRKVKITTIRGEIYRCKMHCPAEDEDDWAYQFITPDYPTKYFILECNFIERIEEISDDEWQQACENPVWENATVMVKWHEEQKAAMAKWNTEKA